MTVRQHTREDKTPLGGAWYGRLRCSHHPKEDTDVLPSPCDRMDHYDPDAPARFEQTASHRLGAVEPGDGAGALVCVDRGQRVFGDVAAPQRRRGASAI